MPDSSSRLITIEDHFRCPVDGDGNVLPGAHPAEPSTWCLPRAAAHSGHSIPAAKGLGSSVNAYVNHGRWVVDCPCCPSAQLVSPDDPKFWCPECGSEGVWWAVTFPADRAALEDALCVRPQPDNQNWTDTETLADIQAENSIHLEDEQ